MLVVSYSELVTTSYIFSQSNNILLFLMLLVGVTGPTYFTE